MLTVEDCAAGKNGDVDMVLAGCWWAGQVTNSRYSMSLFKLINYIYWCECTKKSIYVCVHVWMWVIVILSCIYLWFMIYFYIVWISLWTRIHCFSPCLYTQLLAASLDVSSWGPIQDHLGCHVGVGFLGPTVLRLDFLEYKPVYPPTCSAWGSSDRSCLSGWSWVRHLLLPSSCRLFHPCLEQPGKQTIIGVTFFMWCSQRHKREAQSDSNKERTNRWMLQNTIQKVASESWQL